MKQGFSAWFSSFIEGSAICRGFGRFGSFLYKKIGSGLYSFLFGSYDEMCDTFDNGCIGGALGGTLGMRAFHHKTKHKEFRFGFPALLGVQCAAVVYLILIWKQVI